MTPLLKALSRVHTEHQRWRHHWRFWIGPEPIWILMLVTVVLMQMLGVEGETSVFFSSINASVNALRLPFWKQGTSKYSPMISKFFRAPLSRYHCCRFEATRYLDKFSQFQDLQVSVCHKNWKKLNSSVSLILSYCQWVMVWKLYKWFYNEKCESNFKVLLIPSQW